MARLGHRGQSGETFRIGLDVREGTGDDKELDELMTLFECQMGVLQREGAPSLQTVATLSRVSRLMRLRFSRSLTRYRGDYERALRLLSEAHDAMQFSDPVDVEVREARKNIGARLGALEQQLNQGYVSLPRE